MTNSPSQPPQPPEQPSSSKNKNLDSDELIAIIVAFGTIGTILLLSLIGDKSRWGFKNWQQWLATPQVTNQDRTNAFDATKLNQPVVSSKQATPEKPTFERRLTNEPQLLPERSRVVPKQRPNVIVAQPTKPSPPQATKPTPIPKATESIPAAIIFQDVKSDYWASPFIYKLKERGLISGLSENNFQPEQPITRAGMAKLISEAFNQPAATGTNQFMDVIPNTEAATKINEAVAGGFMKGYSDGEFRPQEEISRYQVLVTLAAGLNLQPTQEPNTILQPFNDADQLPKWSVNQVAAAIESGLLVNPPSIDKQSLQPNQTATRAEVAAMIYQALAKAGKLPPVSSQYVVPAR